MLSSLTAGYPVIQIVFNTSEEYVGLIADHTTNLAGLVIVVEHRLVHGDAKDGTDWWEVGIPVLFNF